MSLYEENAKKTTADLIEYYHGTVHAQKNGVFLAHYGNADVLWYGVGWRIRFPADGTESAVFSYKDVWRNTWGEEIQNLLAHPETIADYLGIERSEPKRILLPLDAAGLEQLKDKMRRSYPDWEITAQFPEFLIARRMQHIRTDRWTIAVYREYGHFEGAPPLWDETLTKEQAALFSKNPDKMYAYYLKLTAEKARRRAES